MGLRSCHPHGHCGGIDTFKEEAMKTQYTVVFSMFGASALVPRRFSVSTLKRNRSQKSK
jgi:hypothetical protein